jgi:MSHA biogenesis protein MshJ
MKKQFHSLLQRIDALSERERGILFVLCSIGVLLLGFTFWLEPQMKLRKNLLTQHQANQTQITLLQEEIQQRSAVLSRDPDIELRAKIEEAKVRLLAMDQDLLSLQKNLVPAEKIDLLLARILKRNKSLQLISLKSLPVVNLVAAMDVKDTVTTQAEALPSTMPSNTVSIQNEHSIYKHEVELTLQGNYLDMLAYMRELEALPERVYWSRSSLQVLEYPKASLRLNLFTLSLEKKWLNL